ncbi:metallopeptidase family protein [Actinopolymorpha singaporensis]
MSAPEAPDDAGAGRSVPPTDPPGSPLPAAQAESTAPAAGGPNGRPARRRDRHGRGMRGPIAVRGPLAPGGVPIARSRAERFDEYVLDAVEELERRFATELDGVEFAVEDVPDPRRDHGLVDIPLGAVLASSERDEPARIVLYRRPIELRAVGTSELSELVHDVVVEQVADLLGLGPADVDPDYGEE